MLLRDALKGDDPQIAAFRTALTTLQPDIIALQGVDYDLRLTALRALADGLNYPFLYSARPNAGQSTGLDMNGNGRFGDADDAQGYGRFYGMGSMAVMSRFPIETDAVEDYSAFLWRDLPNHLYPMTTTGPFGGAEVFASHRLSSRGHWVVPITVPDIGALRLMTYHATPPLYDGPEDRNGRRNHDETAFWLDYLSKDASDAPFILAGTANTDPDRGSGRPEAILHLLSRPELQNPFDASPTADFKDPKPGDLRVDYLLPSIHWTVLDHGMLRVPDASRHSILWVDVTLRHP
ncbi:Endonuclease/exonuclease/phosphatase [Sulfitobacter donghicola DSW-25 = KCTC 12864 = JCM 14565]|nr:Endonuclease/exonuclease/phosphatase [Sulfitobacter donghicola DSW-25 = KCTC 12864 = JCM 14565]